MKINTAIVSIEKVSGQFIVHIGTLHRQERFRYNCYTNYELKDLIRVLYEDFFIDDPERLYVYSHLIRIDKNILELGKVHGIIECLTQELEIEYCDMRKDVLWAMSNKIEWEEKEKLIYQKLKELQKLK